MPKYTDVYSNFGGFDLYLSKEKPNKNKPAIDRNKALELFEKYKMLVLWTVNHRFPVASGRPGVLSDEIKSDALLTLWRLILSIGESLTTHQVSNNIWSRIGQKIRKCKCTKYSIDSHSSKNSDLDVVKKFSTQSCEKSFEDNDFLKKIIESSDLNKRELKILQMNMSGYNFAEIAKKYRVSRTRIYQIYWKSIEKMSESKKGLETKNG